MITRIRIKQGPTIVLDLAERQAFWLYGVDYPADWLARGGTIPGHTVVTYDATPPPPPTPPPAATGAQMIYEAEARGKLTALAGALSAPEMMKLTARRRIVAGDDIAEAVRARLGVSAAAMASFIAAAAVRGEV